jgi:hypothetical protein
MTLRSLFSLPLLAALSMTLAHPASAAQAAGAPPVKQTEPSKNADQGNGSNKAARERDDARQELWDRRMKALTKGICKGC